MFSFKAKSEQDKNKGSILIVDYEKPWQNLLFEILRKMNYRVELAGSYEDAKNLLAKTIFDVAVIEPRLDIDDTSNLDGMRLVALIRNTRQSKNTIIYTAFPTIELIEETRKYQILDFVDKAEHPEYIVVAIEKAMSVPPTSNSFPHLTISEQEVLELVVNGKSDREIAKETERSDDTIKKHVGSILAKLGVEGRAQLVEKAVHYHLTVLHHEPKRSNQFRYLLQKAIDLYAKTQKRKFSDVLADMDDQLGCGRKSQTVQSWLNESVVPNSAEVEYFAKKITKATNLDIEWANTFFDAAGYKMPDNIFEPKSAKTENLSKPPVVIRDNVLIGNTQIIVNLESAKQQTDIFISYARADIDIVQTIYKTLLGKNHYPWMDVHSLKGGENWLRAIYKAIDGCEIFLAILSNNSVSRRGVIQKELKKALDKWEGMLPDDIYIIPIRIDDCPIPELLRHIQVLDWDGGKGKNKLFEAIRVGLTRRRVDG